MAMLGVDDISSQTDSQYKLVGLVWRPAATWWCSLYSSDKPSKLSQFHHDDSNIITLLVIIITLASCLICARTLLEYVIFRGVARNLLKEVGRQTRGLMTEVPSEVQGQSIEILENTNGAVTKIDIRRQGTCAHVPHLATPLVIFILWVRF